MGQKCPKDLFPSPSSHKINNKAFENGIVEKAWEDFLEKDALHAEKNNIVVALKYIHDNLLSPSLSVREVAEKNKIKTHCFYDRFADEVTLNGNARRTPREYITWARMQVARRILEHGACDLKEVASKVGFNSYRSFSRACRKHLGCNPSEAQKEHVMRKASGRSERKGISLLELMEMFPDEKAACRWFETIRWPDGERFCPRCGCMNSCEVKNRKPMPYWCPDCRSYFSVKTGTTMQRSRLPLRKWVFALHLSTTNLKGVSSMKLHRDLRITQSAAWYMQQRIRAGWSLGSEELLSGDV